MKLLSLLALIGAAAGKPAAAHLLLAGGEPSGIYGNVQDSPETGDMSGYELRFFRKSGALMVELTLCEGWCNDTYTVPVVRDGNGYIAEYQEISLDQDGRPHNGGLNRLRLVSSRGGLLITHWVDDRRAWAGMKPVRVKPQRHLYGLAVARDQMRECRRSKRCAGG